MLENIPLDKILFLDIETVAQQPDFNKVDERLQKFWEQKSKYIAPEETPEDAYSRAGIYAEFGKIVCISVGFISYEGNRKTLRLKSFYGDDEKLLLEEFFELLRNYFNSPNHLLCAHNGKEFDFPYIARRALVNGLDIPSILDLAGKKPWEVAHLDTLQLWKFGDYKNYTSLGLLTAIFDIPTPKDDIDGSMVNQVYWEEKDVERIKIYCEKDVVALTQLFLRYRNEALIEEEDMVFN